MLKKGISFIGLVFFLFGASASAASVDLVWSADTYTPWWYEGKALPTSQAKVRIEAIPDFRDAKGLRISPAKLIYKWTQGQKTFSAASGLGKSALDLNTGSFGNEVAVLVTAADGKTTAEAYLRLPTYSPQVLVYENSPLSGLKPSPVTNKFKLNSPSINLKAEPFYFSIGTPLRYVWTTTDRQLSDYNDKDKLTFVADESLVREIPITLNVSHPNFRLQLARSTFNFIYE